MYLVPEPKEIYIYKEDRCKISHEFPIIISKYNENDFYSAKCLKRKIKELAMVDLSIEAHCKIKGIEKFVLLLNLSDYEDTYEGFSKCEYQKKLKEEGYFLEITCNKVVVVALDSRGVFYGVQTLIQLLNNTRGLSLPELSISDYPDFPIRGVMLDVSRDWMPNFKTLKRLVYNLSEYKINHLQLYMEPQVFKSRRHSEINNGWGCITAEELMELGKTCRECHIDFVPNMQSFGHMMRVLACKGYEHLAENPEIKGCLSPAVNETYTFLEDIYCEFLPLFSSCNFNVGCDETFDIREGNGNSSELSREKGTAAVYFGHVEKVRELASQYGKQIMIWADQITHENDESYLKAANKLSRDISLVNWWYDPEWNYDDTEKIMEQMGFKHMFCPGTSSWVRFYPEYNRAKQNIREFAVAAYSNKSAGMLISDWGEAGHLNLLEQSYYGFLYAANIAWNFHSDDDDYFDKAFCLNFAGDDDFIFSKLNNALCYTYEILRNDHDYRNVLFDICFYEGLLSDEAVDKKARALACWGNIDRSLRASEYTDSERVHSVECKLTEALKLHNEIDAGKWKNQLLYEELEFTIRQMLFTCKKFHLIKTLQTKIYKTEKLRQELERLLEENRALQKTFINFWLGTGHPEGTEFHNDRFEWVNNDIRFTIEELTKGK